MLHRPAWRDRRSAAAEKTSGHRPEAERPWLVRARRGLGGEPAEVDAAGSERLGRERRDELLLLLRPGRLDRHLVGVERPLEVVRVAGRSTIGRSAVELRERDVLFVDGHARSTSMIADEVRMRSDLPR